MKLASIRDTLRAANGEQPVLDWPTVLKRRTALVGPHSCPLEQFLDHVRIGGEPCGIPAEPVGVLSEEHTEYGIVASTECWYVELLHDLSGDEHDS